MRKIQEINETENKDNDPEIGIIRKRIAGLEYTIAENHWQKARSGDIYKIYFLIAAKAFLNLGKITEARKVIRESGLTVDNVDEFDKNDLSHAANILNELGFKKSARRIAAKEARKYIVLGEFCEAAAIYGEMGMNVEAMDMIKSLEDSSRMMSDIDSRISLWAMIRFSYEEIGERARAEIARSRQRILEKEKNGKPMPVEKIEEEETRTEMFIRKFEEQLNREMAKEEKDAERLVVFSTRLRKYRTLSPEEEDRLKVFCKQITEDPLYYFNAEFMAECYIEIGAYDKAISRMVRSAGLCEMYIENKKQAIALGLMAEDDLVDTYKDLIDNLKIQLKIREKYLRYKAEKSKKSAM